MLHLDRINITVKRLQLKFFPRKVKKHNYTVVVSVLPGRVCRNNPPRVCWSLVYLCIVQLHHFSGGLLHRCSQSGYFSFHNGALGLIISLGIYGYRVPLYKNGCAIMVLKSRVLWRIVWRLSIVLKVLSHLKEWPPNEPKLSCPQSW